MKKIYLFLLFITSSYLAHAQVKIGDNPTSVGTSSALELESTNKALVITRVASTAAIANPVDGMIIYDISSKCIKSYEDGNWTNCLSNGTNIQPSTNGTAVVSSYVCSTGSTGTLSAGEQVSGVTQTITANVTQLGTYSINAFANGVVFSASGTFTSLGSQTVVLSAIGTPVNVGSDSFTLNTIPNCSFSRTTEGNPSSGGTAIVSGFTCNTASAGTPVVGTAVSGVTQTITATVTTVGTYNITATTNGIIFTGTGTFAGTGAQDVELTATGTPTTAGSNSFTLSTTPNCSFTRTVISATTGGTAVVSAYNCSGSSIGTLTIGTAATNVTQIITATVTTVGTYNISIPAVNGISWSASGTFTGTGSQSITLTASGTPTVAGTTTFALPTTPTCSFTRSVGDVFSATVCATSTSNTFPQNPVIGSTTVTVSRTGTVDTTSNTTTCGISITGTSNNLDASESSTYTFSVPVRNLQILTWGDQTLGEGYSVTATLAGVSVPVQLVPFGGSCSNVYQPSQIGNTGIVSLPSATSSSSVIFNISSLEPYDRIVITRLNVVTTNNHGLIYCNATAVPNTTSGGSAVISSITCNTANRGTLVQGQESGPSAFEPKTQTLTANVTTVGGYNISATANGVTFAASGTFTATGNNTIVLVASGIPTAAGTHAYTLNTTPSCSFNRQTVTSFSLTNCGAFNAVYPASYTVSSQTVNVAKSPNTAITYNSPFPNTFCLAEAATGSISRIDNNGSITYTFSRNLNNVQIFSADNEYNEEFEGLTVLATKGGVSVPVYLVSVVNNCMNENIITSTSGNSASIRNYRSISPTLPVNYIVNVSCPTGYDTLTIIRAGSAGGGYNTHGLRYCNASIVP